MPTLPASLAALCRARDFVESGISAHPRVTWIVAVVLVIGVAVL